MCGDTISSSDLKTLYNFLKSLEHSLDLSTVKLMRAKTNHGLFEITLSGFDPSG